MYWGACSRTVARASASSIAATEVTLSPGAGRVSQGMIPAATAATASAWVTKPRGALRASRTIW